MLITQEYRNRLLSELTLIPKGVPLIIKTQVTKPDNSQIWMTFQNATQYPEKGMQTFQVEFQRGKVVSINNISEETPC